LGDVDSSEGLASGLTDVRPTEEETVDAGFRLNALQDLGDERARGTERLRGGPAGGRLGH
jgi:hypothetical protein